jgi:hypothetical protein
LPTETCAFNDIAFQVGTFAIVASDPGMTGKYMLILRRAYKGWLIQYDIWNLDQIAAPTA